MNYRHDFHAGNFADVFKHIVLTRILLHLLKKPTPFRYIDTHAGSGFYDLFGSEAARTGEWQAGLGRLAAAEWPADVRELIEPYWDLAEPAARETGCLYPGSPAIAAALLRPQDRMIFCELHPAALLDLQTQFAKEKRAKVIGIDGFTGLNAYVPPVERRGVVLIDPAYELRDDLEHSLKVLETAWRKWSTGIFVLWYPIKDRRDTEHALRAFADGKVRRVLRIELQIAEPAPAGALVANGLLIVNPPFPLQAEAEILVPFLAKIMAGCDSAKHRIDWLAGE